MMYHFHIPDAWWPTILAGLGELPAKHSHDIINNLVEQIKEQTTPKPPPAADPPTPAEPPKPPDGDPDPVR